MVKSHRQKVYDEINASQTYPVKEPAVAENPPVYATLVDNKGRTWTESPETATKNSTPVWLLEHLRLEHEESGGWYLRDEHRKFSSGLQPIKKAIDALDVEIKAALVREGHIPPNKDDQEAKVTFRTVAGSILPEPITDREGRVWTLQPSETPGEAFWFALVSFRNDPDEPWHKKETRIVPEGGGRYLLGVVSASSPRALLQEVSIEKAIDLACREFLPKEPAAQPPAPALDSITDKDGRIWRWFEAEGSWKTRVEESWVRVYWHEGEPQRWFLDVPTSGPIDLHQTTIRPAIRDAAKYLTEPKEATMPKHDDSAAPYTDSAGRTWTFDVRDGGWHTDVVFSGKYHAAEITMERGEGTWVLKGLDPDPTDTGIVKVSAAIESVRERIDVVTLMPETAAAIYDGPVVDAKDWAKQIDQQEAPVTGAWLVVTEYGGITVYLAEIDALRAVNGQDAKAFFVADGTTLADARGW